MAAAPKVIEVPMNYFHVRARREAGVWPTTISLPCTPMPAHGGIHLVKGGGAKIAP